MPVTPLILLTFSNDDGDYLPSIIKEQKALKKALLNFADKNYIQVRDLQRASTKEIFYLINRYHQRIHIFHYGGHASEIGLQLEEEIGIVQSANAKGIGNILGTLEYLKLVFLNGCATREQVNLLLEKGVQAVIATSVEVKDSSAFLFASQFYEALGTGSTIRKAFQKAKAYFDTIGKGPLIKDLEEARGLALRSDSNKEKSFPWGLYWKEANTEILDWKIPEESFFELNIGAESIKSKRVNDSSHLMVDRILKAIQEGVIVQRLIEKIANERKNGNQGRRLNCKFQ